MTNHFPIHMPRVVVDEFSADDLDGLTQIFEHMYEKGQPWYNVDPNDPATIQAFLDQALSNQREEPRENYRMAIRFRDHSGGLRLIGYVSLCKIFSQDEGFPDTGVFIDPRFQQGSYAREARVGIMMFAFCLGHITKLYCDIEQSNIASQTNVRGMGYGQHFDVDGNAVEIPTKTLDGEERWYRFSLDQHTFDERLPLLLERLSERWGNVQPKAMMAFNETRDRLVRHIPIPDNDTSEAPRAQRPGLT